jgi:hypothetical protein
MRPDQPGSRLLADASALVRRGWTRLAEARDVEGVPVEPWSELAVEWSLLGALVASLERGTAAGATPDVVELAAACVRLAHVIEEPSLQRWNDAEGRSRDEVVEVLERAHAGRPHAGLGDASLN